MFLIAVLGFLLVGLSIAVMVVLFRPSNPSPAVAQAAPQATPSWHAPVFAPTLTAREQDRQVQSSLVAEWYSQSLDDQFRKETLDDIALKLAARK